MTKIITRRDIQRIIKEEVRRRSLNEDYNPKDYGDVYDFLIDYNIATEEEIQLVCDIDGKSVRTLNDILFARTGYRSIDQWEK
jgi:hypothetical protein